MVEAQLVRVADPKIRVLLKACVVLAHVRHQQSVGLHVDPPDYRREVVVAGLADGEFEHAEEEDDDEQSSHWIWIIISQSSRYYYVSVHLSGENQQKRVAQDAQGLREKDFTDKLSKGLLRGSEESYDNQFGQLHQDMDNKRLHLHHR